MSAGGEHGQELIAALKRVGNRKGPALGVLWTWLEKRLPDLGERQWKSPEILERVDGREYTGFTDEIWRSLEEDPVMGAAELLATIDQSIDPASELIEEAKGIHGESVLVCLRKSMLVMAAGGIEEPPSAHEHPSLTTLAPNIVVSKVDLDGIALDGRKAKGRLWQAVFDELHDQFSGNPPRIEVHLDTLGSHGLTGWIQPPGERRGHFGPMTEADRLAVVAAAREAVRRASVADTATILVMPELAVDESALAAIKEELRAHEDDGPCLTFVGLRHRSAEDEDPIRSDYVNEAVVLAPNGTELWRHRKLKYAGASEVDGGHQSFVEDIRPGRTLTVVQTPVGNLALVICLDSFGDESRERLAESPANVIFVPSLSKSAKPHRVSLDQLVNKLFAIAFVCNRSPYLSEGPDQWNGEKARSFWTFVISGSTVPPEKVDPQREHPSFVFKLEDKRKQSQGSTEQP
ncbi:MAG TPA: nitrilase-related carbon-nitrogen hydrolase [Solirubrobacterales bacterium]|nr:nitrilase-related carbon-nitrogen hydrolase [Solirubrobacterales bacterium]